MRFWVREPLIVKVFLVSMFVVVAIAIVLLARLAGRLYRHSGGGISREDIVTGKVEPEVFAAYALANKAPNPASRTESSKIESSTDRVAANAVLYSVRAVERSFIYLYESSDAEIESIKRVSALIFLLSLMMVAFGATPTYLWNCNNNNLPELLCLFGAVDQLLDTLALGLSLSAILHLVSGVFERTLNVRRAGWKYFLGTLKSELSDQ
jgi:hypothetical protein